MQPLVSVLMPVYNGEKYISEAVESILSQSYTDFELIITDDGSDDRTPQIIKAFNDDRIRCIIHAENKGLIFSRNEGVAAAKGRYIAFLDSDDVSLPQRLEKQISFLDAHPDFGMIGAWVKVIDGHGNSLNDCIKFPALPDEIPVILLFKNYFTTSSIMVRKSCLQDFPFDPEFPIAEDYNLWIKIAEKYKVWNLPEVLTCYRMHKENIHKKLDKKMRELDMLQLSKQLSKFNTDFSNEEKYFFFLIGKMDYPEEYALFLKTDFVFADKCFNKMYLANRFSNSYINEIFWIFLYKLWLELFIDIEKFNIKLFKKLRFSVFFNKISRMKKFKFFIKCLLNLNITKN